MSLADLNTQNIKLCRINCCFYLPIELYIVGKGSKIKISVWVRGKSCLS